MDIQAIQTLEVDSKQIGAKLLRLREAKEMTQADVAKALGCKRGQVWQFERGTALTVENLAKLAMFFDKPIDFFIEK